MMPLSLIFAIKSSEDDCKLRQNSKSIYKQTWYARSAEVDVGLQLMRSKSRSRNHEEYQIFIETAVVNVLPFLFKQSSNEHTIFYICH